MHNITKRTYARISGLLMTLLLSLVSYTSLATHIYGADLFYSHVSGLTYKITLVVYGDCAGSAFPGLLNTSAQVRVYNGSTTYTTLTLSKQSPSAGVEVTPVCASQAGNTVCSNTSSTIPGVKKFTYSANVTLNTTSSNWRFRFTGNMGSGPSAGRSQNITNITNPSTSTMNLEATLNNTNGPNSSVTYTTIPTPFFCINKAASYNPGTTDINGDSTSNSLVAGLVAGGTVSYVTGYSATAPLSATSGTFSFSAQTGQLNFTPNMVQRSLVVTQVSEYRNGVLVGTSMREMTFVVLNNCNNNPPGGKISNSANGTIFNSGTSLKSCKSNGTISFNINPTDLDNDTINVVANGLPSGATFSISNNNTKTPTCTFSWNVSGVSPGTYNFFITYTDAGCPLSSKQTIAYSIEILADPDVSVNLNSSATCTKKAVFTMTPSGTPSPWHLQILNGSSVVHNFTGVANSQQDSLSPGSYTLRVYNADTCFKDVALIIDPPPTIDVTLDIRPLRCHDDSDAIVVVLASGGNPAFTYALGTGPYGTNDTFKNLYAGYHTFKIKDQNDCVKDTLIRIDNPLPISADVILQQPPCNYYNSGVITINGKNGVTPYKYAFNNNPYGTTHTFSGLYSGTYPVKIKDSNNCLLDTSVVLPDSIKVHATPTLTHIKCYSDSTGIVILNAYGGTAPYRYQQVGWTSLTPVNTFTNLPAQTFNFHIEDTNKCYLDTAIKLNEPPPITSTSSLVNILCFSDTTGTITINGSGGVSPYKYALGGGTYTSSGTFTPLPAGTHTIHIKDSNNCIKDTNVTLTQPTELFFDALQIDNPLCYASSSGQVVLSGTGGVTPYVYAVSTSPFSSNPTFGGLAAGNTIFYIKDNNGCTKDTTLTLTQPTRIVPSAAVVQSTCTPLDNGKIVLSATGGVPGYTYALGMGTYSASPSFSPLATGTYQLHVRDKNNCIMDTTLLVKDSLIVKSSINISDALCFDSSSGIITFSPSGGLAPYTFSVGGGPFGSTPSVGGLHSGTYNVSIKDDLGCKKDTSINIGEPTAVSFTLSKYDPTCYKYTDGVITINATGGTPGYEYALNGSAYVAQNIFNALPAGQYTVKIKDINNCIMDTTLSLIQPPVISFTVNVTDLKCHNDSSGIVKVSGSGGTAPYQYTFNNNPFSADPQLKGLSAGPNVIKMKDVNSCVIDSTITLTEPAKLLLTNPLITNPTCEGYKDGSVKIYGNGGVKPYQYSANGGASSSNNLLSNLDEGNNTIRVQDANGCKYDTTLMLTGLPHIVYDNLEIEDIKCHDGTNGQIILNVSGGVQPLKYKINNSGAQAGNTFSNLGAGKYTFTTVDNAGCTKDSAVLMNQPEPIVIKTKVTPNDCEGIDNSGMISAEVTGGTPSYYFEWNTDPVQYSNSIQGMPNGTYRVRVTDDNDCIDTAKATIVYNNCCIVFVPDAFTPNGDGLNDVIHMRVKGDFTLKTFAIYNRYGQMVFQTSNINDGWDGVFNSRPQQLDTYNYYIQGICGNAGTKDVMYKGTITLVR